MNAGERLDQIQARADAATDGAWMAYFGIHGDPFVVRDLRRVKFTQVAEVSKAADDYGRADALFIAAARQDVPDLVAALRAVLGKCEKVTQKWDRLAEAGKTTDWWDGKDTIAREIAAAIDSALGDPS